MKLFVTGISPNSRRVEAVLHHLGLYDQTEVVRLSVGAGEHRTAEIEAANPNVKLPILIDGDMNLWESNPMMIYLCDKVGAEDFCPSGLEERFEILRWMFWEKLHFNKAVGDIVWETIAKAVLGIGAPDADVIASARNEFLRFGKILDDQLSGQDFVLGNTLSVADFAVGSHSGLALYAQSQVPIDEFPNLKAWYLRLESLPAWAATAPELMSMAAE